MIMIFRWWLGVPKGHPIELYYSPRGTEPDEDTGLLYPPNPNLTVIRKPVHQYEQARPSAFRD